ncbi:DUF2243 domain-containing protein [Streptomyces sp. NPDC058011]|uniref:DUF2243 domain-containing protein n=1 Tax=Streptomyces sp. NPDC058011 TaxID=3346305 RepID=UPI0036E844D2
MSDGLLHTAELPALIAGFFLYADLRRSRTLAPSYAWAGLFLGLGAFQLFDGIVDHTLCACTRSVTAWTLPPTTGHGTSPAWRFF